MDNPRRRRITLTHWLLIVIAAALVTNAALETISIVQRRALLPREIDPAGQAELDKLRKDLEATGRLLEPLTLPKDLSDAIERASRNEERKLKSNEPRAEQLAFGSN
jgi:hypothetical protein